MQHGNHMAQPTQGSNKAGISQKAPKSHFASKGPRMRSKRRNVASGGLYPNGI